MHRGTWVAKGLLEAAVTHWHLAVALSPVSASNGPDVPHTGSRHLSPSAA